MLRDLGPHRGLLPGSHHFGDSHMQIDTNASKQLSIDCFGE